MVGSFGDEFRRPNREFSVMILRPELCYLFRPAILVVLVRSTVDGGILH
jgi:hypothetical protein